MEFGIVGVEFDGLKWVSAREQRHLPLPLAAPEGAGHAASQGITVKQDPSLMAVGQDGQR